MTSLTTQLERIWHAQIPISAAMGIRIASYANDVLEVHADLSPNVNVHGTAFAGSLYAIAALTGWGSTWLQLRDHQHDGSIVIAEGNIRYVRPVAEEIVARCRFDAASQGGALRQLSDAGKCRFPLECVIEASGADAAIFTGLYAVRLHRSD